MPAATLTGDVVERGRKRTGLKSGPLPVQYPMPVEPQISQTEVVNLDPTPEEAVVESAVIAVGENIQAVAVEETHDGEIVAMAQAYNWFKLSTNVVFFILVFWIGAAIAAMVF